MKLLLRCLFALLPSAVSFASIVPIVPAKPEWGAAAGIFVFEARAAVERDELLVVREIVKTADGRVFVDEFYCAAHKMDATYRLVISSAVATPTINDVKTSREIRLPKNGHVRPTTSDTALKIEVASQGEAQADTYLFTARIEKTEDFARRHPGFKRPTQDFDHWSSSGRRPITTAE